jgi:O-antigen/teichoic acid export membrane protein
MLKGKADILGGERVPETSRPRFWQDNLWLNGAGVLAGLSNVGYHVVVARMLGPLNYGVLQGLTSLTAVLQAPVSIVALVYTRRGARVREVWRLNLLWLGVGFGVWLALWGTAGGIAHVFQLPQSYVVLYGLTVVTAFALGLCQGIMQWAAAFAWVGGLTALASAGRMVAALITYWRRWGLPGLVVSPALVAGAVTATAVTGALASARRAQRAGFRRYGGLANAGVVGVLTLLMTSADVLAAKHALSGHAAGLYSGLSTMGRAPAYFAGAVGTVLLSASQRDTAHARRYLWRSLGLVAALGALGIGVYGIMGGWLIRLSLGGRFIGLLPHLALFTGAMSLEAVEMIVLYYAAAREWTELTVLGVAGFLGWMGVVWFTHSLDVLISRTIWVMGLQAAASLLTLTVLERRGMGSGHHGEIGRVE